MKSNTILLIYMLMSGFIYGKDVTYDTTFSSYKIAPVGTKEIITHQENGFKRVTVLDGEEIVIYTTTNAQQETTELSFVQEDETNRYFIQDNKIHTPYGKVKLKDNKFIAFPEVQLDSFLADSNQQELSYFSIRTDNKKAYNAIATKIKEDDDMVLVQITFKGIIPSILKFVYYYSKETKIAYQKESYFFSKKPYYIMKLK